VHLSLKILPLVATIMIFPKNQLTKEYNVDHQDETPSPCGGSTILGGGTPDAGCGTPFRLNLTTE